MDNATIPGIARENGFCEPLRKRSESPTSSHVLGRAFHMSLRTRKDVLHVKRITAAVHQLEKMSARPRGTAELSDWERASLSIGSIGLFEEAMLDGRPRSGLVKSGMIGKRKIK